MAKKNTLHARRLVISRLHDRRMIDPKDQDTLLEDSLVQKLFNDIAPIYADRHGGYTRIIKTAKWRIGDAGDIAIIQLVDVAKVVVRGKKKAATAA